MIRVALRQLATVLQAELYGTDICGTDTYIDDLVTDTRQLTQGCLFIAISGERFDGHDFAQQAQTAGATALLVNRALPQINLPQLVVADTRQALGKIAGWLREQMPVCIVALTGSSGKTSVKEMTAAILRQCGNTLFTEGNLNNDIGVPLTLLRLTPQHQFAVIELGANHSGEIARTVSLVRPWAALVNNLTAAHLAGFGSLEGVARAKGEIFSALAPQGIAIINADSNDQPGWLASIGERTLWRFSASGQHSDFYASQLQHSVIGDTAHHAGTGGIRFILHTPQGATDITLPLVGKHNLANALAAAALAMAVGASLPAIQQGLAQCKPMSGRLFPIRLAPEQWLIDDSYNANVGSMQAAIAVLAEQPGYRVLVAGDMAELGEQTDDCHRQVGEMARRAGIDRVLTTGRLSAQLSQHSGAGEHFADKAALLARLRELLVTQPVISIVIKGSRSSAMEQVVQALQEGASC